MTYKKTVLPNGLRIITVPMKENRTVTVYVLVETGSKYENKKNNGISHFLEHMCFKGTVRRTRDEIAYEFDSIGASNNAFTSREYTGYYAKAPKGFASKILDIVSDIYLNSTFPEAEMEKEKGVVIEEIKMYEDKPTSKVGDALGELLYGDQPAGWTITGTPAHIKSLKRQDLVDYHKKFYVPEATTVVIAGNFEPKEIIAEIKERFGTLPKVPRGKKIKVKESQSSPKIALHYKKTDQTHILFGIRTFGHGDEKKNFTLEILDGILGAGMSSRLFKKMREELGICYYIGSGSIDYSDHGVFKVSAGVPIKKLPLAIEGILEELRKLKTELVSDKELKKVKDHFYGQLYMGLESSKSYASFYGFQELRRKKIYEPEEIIKKINEITAQDVKKLANQIFVDKNLNLAIVGPVKDKKNIQKILKF